MIPTLKASARYDANVVLAGLVAPGAGSLDRALASAMAGPGFALANVGDSAQQALTSGIMGTANRLAVRLAIQKVDWVSPLLLKINGVENVPTYAWVLGILKGLAAVKRLHPLSVKGTGMHEYIFNFHH